MKTLIDVLNISTETNTTFLITLYAFYPLSVRLQYQFQFKLHETLCHNNKNYQVMETLNNYSMIVL